MVRTTLASAAIIALFAHSASESRYCPEGKVCFAKNGTEMAATVQVSRWKGGYSCETASDLAEMQAMERAQRDCESENNVSCVQSSGTEIITKESLLRCSATVKIAYEPLAKKVTDTDAVRAFTSSARSAAMHLPNNTDDIIASFGPVGLTPTLAPAIAATAQALEQENKAASAANSAATGNEAKTTETSTLAKSTKDTAPAKAADGIGSAL